jgi:fatty acid desaturase
MTGRDEPTREQLKARIAELNRELDEIEAEIEWERATALPWWVPVLMLAASLGGLAWVTILGWAEVLAR